MVELPAGSLIGLCAAVLVVGVVLGRSGRAMRSIGRMQAAAHGGSAAGGRAAAAGGHSDVRVQTVVVAPPGQGSQVRDDRMVQRGTFDADAGTAVAGELVESGSVTWLDDRYDLRAADESVRSGVERVR